MATHLNNHKHSKVEDESTLVLYPTQTDEDADDNSVEEPPITEWSSLKIAVEPVNPKRLLQSKGLYSPASEEVCCKYVAMSDSDVYGHCYFDFHAITDPGIKAALMCPEDVIHYSENGEELYLSLCEEMNTHPVGLFYRNLLNVEINLSYYGVNPQAIRAMAKALSINKHVLRWNLTDNFLNDDACFHIGEMLKTNHVLRELNLSGCRIGFSGMLRLCKNLPLNHSLTTLDLSRNNLCDEGGVSIAKYIYRIPKLRRLNLSNNELGRATAYAFFEALKYHNNLTHLDLSWNPFHHLPSISHMLEKLGDSYALEDLNLSYTGIEGSRVARAILKVTGIPKLKTLNLSNNRFCDKAVLIIISELKKANNLRTLDLSYNNLTPNDAYNVISVMLEPEVKIKNLYLEKVCVNKDFMLCLESVKQMTCRRNFVVTHGEVLQNWVLKLPDAREVLLKRAQYLSTVNEKHKIDCIVFLLILAREYGNRHVPVKELITRVARSHVPLDNDYLDELGSVFPGLAIGKYKTVDFSLIEEYIYRLWPDKVLHSHHKRRHKHLVGRRKKAKMV